MRTIRSLLWVGSGRGLSESGMTEAPELDVTWVPDVDDAIRLPRVHFDGILLEAASVELVRDSLVALERHAPGTSILVCLPETESGQAEAAIRAGAAATIFLDPKRPGPGIVSDINEALDQIRDGIAPPTPSEPTSSKKVIPLEPIASPDDPLVPDLTGFDSETTPQLIAKSDAMKDVSELVELAASSPSTVLLTGETGVGKEVIARRLHARSGREQEPFIAINCAAFPESLLESELFGHTKGAFTGADRAKAGLFEAAGRGTLFLDEIAEMGSSLQAKLLRVLQEREVRPLGSIRQIPIRCRIIAATNRRPHLPRAFGMVSRRSFTNCLYNAGSPRWCFRRPLLARFSG